MNCQKPRTQARSPRFFAAAEAAGLVDRDVREGPLTVFAPTDEVFAAPRSKAPPRPVMISTDSHPLSAHVVAGADVG
jgi:uncharacterized surface protein with fasciclin (FAS1) repeats